MALQIKFPFSGRLRLRQLQSSVPTPQVNSPSVQGRSLQTCSSCGFSTRHRILFDRHANRCQNGLRPPQVVARNYKCKKCSFATTRSKLYLHHLKRDHGEGINIFSCDLCEYASRYRCKVIRHRKFVHRTAKPIASEALCEDTAMENEDDLEVLNGVEQENDDLEMVDAERIDGIHEMEQGSDDEVQILNNNDVDEGALSGTDTERNPMPLQGSPVKATDNALHYIRRIANSRDSQQPAYQCALCTYSNVQKWKVANHVRTFHMKNKVFKCTFCPYVTSRKIEFCIHKTKHSEKKEWECQECDYKSGSKTNFDRHLASHATVLLVKCTLCKFSAMGDAAVQRHIKECHPQDELALNNMSYDEQQVQEEDQGFQVQPITEPGNLVIVEESNQEEMSCRVCGLKVKNESKLRIHMVSHSTESVHWCPLCTLKYKRSSDLNRHMKRKHGARLRDFFFMGQQEQPLNLTITKSEMEACAMAPSTSVEPEIIDLEGGEDQPLDLTVPKSGNFPIGNLPPENLKCSHCSYQAKWPSDLRRHLLVHSVEKRFKCPCCHRKYKYQFDLNMHLRRMHRMPAGRTKVFNTSAGPPVVNIANLDSSSVTLPAGASNALSDAESMADGPSSDAPKQMLKVNRYKLTRQQVSPQGKYKCDYCPYLGKYQSEVDRHMRLHTGEKPFSCLFCAYRSHWRGDMKRHLQKHHSAEDGVENDITNLMEQTYQPDAPAENGDQLLEGNAEVEEANIKPEAIDIDKEYEDQENQDLELNGKESMGDPGSDQDGMEFMTLTPSSSSSGSASATPNNRVMNGEKRPNLCPYCPFTCEAPSKLKCHMEIHENLKRFKCAHCGKRSNWTWDVRKHIKKEHPHKELNVIVMEEEEARETLTNYLQSHLKVLPKKELPPMSELPTQVPLNRFTDQLPPLEMMGVLAPIHPSNLSDSSYQGDDDGMATYLEPRFSAHAPSMRQPSIATKRCRPFKCSKCGRRSNWKWDMNKHIRNVHPQAKLIILTPEEARATMPKGGFKNPNTGRKENLKMVLQMAYIKPEIPSPQKQKHNHQFDSNRTKKFKCSACPYRSDYRSDIGRHLKRLHSPGTATIQMLSDDEARATLQEYKDRWVRGKFVFSPAKEKLYNEVDQQNTVARKALNNAYDMNPSPSPSTPLTSQNFGDQNQQPLQQTDVIMSQPTTIVVKSEPSTVLVPPCTERTKKWKCPKCAYQNPNKKMVMRHMRQHPKVKVFQCRVCGEASDYRNSMYRHVRNRHNSTDYSGIVHESIAYVTTVVKSEPEANLDADEDVPVTYRCTLCGQTSSWKSGIMRHVAETHNKEKVNEFVEVIRVSNILPALPQQVTNSGEIYFMSPDDAKQLRCDVCPYRTNKSGLLKIHKTYHRPQPGNKFKCKYCPYYVSAMRLLHQHVRLHLQDLPVETNNNDVANIKREDEEEEQMELDLSSDSNNGSAIDPSSPLKTLSGSPGSTQSSSPGRRYYCDQCPAVSRNKNDFLYHKQFHRPKPSAPFKCRLCNYWVSQRRLLRQHERVHLTEYIEHYHNNSINSPKPEVLKTYADKGGSIPQMVLASPAKSDTSNYGDLVQIANIKQQIIASKIQTVPITPQKFRENGSVLPDGVLTIPGLRVDTSGQYLNSGTLRTLNKCHSCPFTSLRGSMMARHEKMHSAKPSENHLQCQYCGFYVPNQSVLSKHIIVHSSTYQPGINEINDVDVEEEEEDDESSQAGEKIDSQAESLPGAPPSLVGSPPRPVQEGSVSGKSAGGAVLDLSCLPKYSEFYVKYDNNNGEHQLERGSFKKWCCEKCPYASMKRAQFERHITLHASNQKYVCEYCDYSVPAYHLLLQHKKLHLHPNPNLLTAQSISNLHRLPEVPADVAAATNFTSKTTDPASQYGSQDAADLFENSSEFSEPKKLYRCDRCPYTNVRRDHLLSHLRFHMVLSDFKCPYCDYSVSKQHLLVQHIKVHFNAPGCEGFNAPNSVLNLSMSCNSPPLDPGASISSLSKPGVEEVPSKESDDNDDAASQPEYIDLAELSKAGLLKPVRATDTPETEPHHTAGEKVVTEDPQEKADGSAKEAVQSEKIENGENMETGNKVDIVEKVENGEKSIDGTGDKWVCQYCDRRFKASQDMLKHERQHLVGNHF